MFSTKFAIECFNVFEEFFCLKFFDAVFLWWIYDSPKLPDFLKQNNLDIQSRLSPLLKSWFFPFSFQTKFFSSGRTFFEEIFDFFPCWGNMPYQKCQCGL